jgi:hypothetical protein
MSPALPAERSATSADTVTPPTDPEIEGPLNESREEQAHSTPPPTHDEEGRLLEYYEEDRTMLVEYDTNGERKEYFEAVLGM